MTGDARPRFFESWITLCSRSRCGAREAMTGGCKPTRRLLFSSTNIITLILQNTPHLVKPARLHFACTERGDLSEFLAARTCASCWLDNPTPQLTNSFYIIIQFLVCSFPFLFKGAPKRRCCARRAMRLSHVVTRRAAASRQQGLTTLGNHATGHHASPVNLAN